MRKLRQAVSLAILLAAPLLLSGCWDNKDINHRSLPVAMGITKNGEEYQVFLQIPEPVATRLQTKIVVEKGDTITKAVDRLSENLESEVDLLHLKVVMIDKKIAALGMSDIFSFFIRVRDISPKALVVLCDEDLETFFTNIKNKMNPESRNLTDFFEKYAGWNPQIALTRIWEVYRSIHSYTEDVVLPIVRSGNTTAISHIGSAIIKNGRMVGTINSDDTLLVNLFKGESGEGKIEVMENASVLINKTSLRLRSRMLQGKPVTKARMSLNVSLLEVKGQTSVETIKQDLKDQLNHRFTKLLAKAQNGQADILSLGQTFRRQIPRSLLQNWRESLYPDLRVDFDIHINVQDEGFLKTN
ncbi:Ger(x)C family spore germination protein [Paenibacillus whitsoniae]|uniref:Ger(X)C family spore germination protein n=1 Tax=Paenibacillus whitsoniae TaxID=2496558 RepID=A0A3S0A9E7_9BACL|nr:Ger(x)C family spore germination protein [Paenibacillus whitsoniae]RTE07743.1 Ger(x)C family spore germination protein [Paenibacillus whitsoniae]